MPAYEWQCRVCSDNNIAGSQVCESCGSPAELSAWALYKRNGGKSGIIGFLIALSDSGHGQSAITLFLLWLALMAVTGAIFLWNIGALRWLAAILIVGMNIIIIKLNWKIFRGG